jgi:multidrug efflux pump subunit AcrA (membrane-fusion protein)
VREGDTVAAGAVIATVEDPKLALQRAALDARLEALAAQRRQAQLELERTRQLRVTGAATQARLDEAETALEVIEQQRREGEILAPQDGRVLAVRGVPGSVVFAGEPVAVIATDIYVLRLRLPERHARFLRVGEPVQVGARGLAERPDAALGQGAIRLVYPRLDAGQVVADAEVAGLGDFFVGERVQVTIVADRRAAIVVPRALIHRGTGVDLVRLATGARVPVQPGPEREIDGTPAFASGSASGSLSSVIGSSVGQRWQRRNSTLDRQADDHREPTPTHTPKSPPPPRTLPRSMTLEGIGAVRDTGPARLSAVQA